MWAICPHNIDVIYLFTLYSYNKHIISWFVRLNMCLFKAIFFTIVYNGHQYIIYHLLAKDR